MSIEQAQELPINDGMPPEAIEAGIPLGAWLLAQRYGNNGFKTVDEVLSEKAPVAYRKYKQLLAERSRLDEEPQLIVETDQVAENTEGPRTLPPIAAEYRDKIRGQARPPAETSDDKTP
jgi:hypothetical protein